VIKEKRKQKEIPLRSNQFSQVINHQSFKPPFWLLR